MKTVKPRITYTNGKLISARVLMVKTPELRDPGPDAEARLLWSKEDELKSFAEDERKILRLTIPFIRQRMDHLIKLLLPFKEPSPTFTDNATGPTPR